MTRQEINIRTSLNKIGCQLKSHKQGFFIKSRYTNKVISDINDKTGQPIIMSLNDVEKWISNKKQKEIAEQKAYKKLLKEYSGKILYPLYGEWCVNLILEKLKEIEIKDSKEFLNSVFDPKDEYYTEYFDYTIKNISERINEDRCHKNSLYWMLENAFGEKYFDMYYSMNEELLKKEPDVVSDLCNSGDITMLELLDDALEEIGVETLRKVIFEKIS